ncbi:peptidylprolyl isomerase [Pseudomarimonas arenosa]|uniref:peptidylprolyl isomerase n=1 Tax=Pseudomarimonas arenosa TaxID=2774145 RepID=A0AAW3ZK27_9GAMM|nr:peptidyl-prolyl cis-trans isomerase [Pseudomarimonas arenosa]MBD8526440.1 peptidylprolyl isomerase [Pseudomarimonas arenosa]
MKIQFILCLLALPMTAQGQALEPELSLDTVVASRGKASLTLGEIDAKVRTMPPELRAGYLTEPDRIARLIDAMLLSEQVAMEAEEAGVGETRELRDDVKLMRNELMANRFINAEMAKVKLPNFELLAKERYTADPKKYAPKDRVDIRHILFSTDGRDEAWAKEKAADVRKRVDSGEPFADVIAAMQEQHGDAVVSDQIPNADLSRLDQRFVVAFSQITKVGGFAGPVRSRFGWHVIQLENLVKFPPPSFDEIKDELVSGLRQEFIAAEKNRFLSSRSQLEVELNGEAISTLPGRYAKDVAGSAEAARAFGVAAEAPAQN